MLGYKRPANHPPPTSFAAVLSTLLAYLSLVVWPILYDYWRFAGWLRVFLVAATLARLCWVGRRQPDERPRVLAMVAVILAMLCSAAAVGVGRAFMGPEGGRASRYVTTTSPLFCALYVAWLVYGRLEPDVSSTRPCSLLILRFPRISGMASSTEMRGGRSTLG